MSGGGAATTRGADQDRHLPISLVLGLGTILVAEALLFVDVSARSWAVLPNGELVPPRGQLHSLGRWVAVNMTPICWVGWLVTLDGLLALHGRRGGGSLGVIGSPVRVRPRRFVLCFLAGIPLWLTFDWINFAFIGAWEYHGLPDDLMHRYLGYFFAFGAISPAMFLTAELYQRLGLRRVRARALSIAPPALIIFVGLGLALTAFPVVVRHPIGTLTLWVGWFFLLDPINHWLGAPSILGDWQAGRWGRTLALLAAGATCGLLWEFWNYWAAAKWTYHLPFLGPLEDYRYFEMPLIGLLGFPTFAIECWVMFQTVVLLCQRLGFRFPETLPDNAALL